MKTNSTLDKNTLQQVLLLCLLIVAIILIFIPFSRQNTHQVLLQNASYVEDSAVQSAKRIDDILNNAQAQMYTMSYLYSKSLTSADIDFSTLESLVDNSIFEYMEFVDLKGTMVDASGNTMDVSGRDYFKDGISGKTGMDIVMREKGDAVQHLLVFYSPLRYQGQIFGLLVGHYREELLHDLLQCTFFGKPTLSFLLNQDGAIIASSQSAIHEENIRDYFKDVKFSDGNSLRNVTNFLHNNKSQSFIYENSDGFVNAYLTAMDQTNIMLLQTFPPSVTNEMIEDANEPGISMEVNLVVAFSLYIILLVALHWKQKKQLITEKEEMSAVIDGTLQLFRCFIVVDLENDTYEYLDDGTDLYQGEIPLKGCYSQFQQFLAPCLSCENEENEACNFISKEHIQKTLEDSVPFVQYEYAIDLNGKRWENVSIIPLTRTDGVATTVLFAIQDTTTLKEEEQKSRAALKAAFQAAEDANWAKSNFLSNMSHDIRTPMNAIMGMTAIAAMHTEEPERIKDCLNKITTSSRHLLGLINQVLDMSKIESGKVSLTEEPFNLSEVIENLITIFHPQIKSREQDLKVNIADITHEDVIGDPVHLQQVFVNIMGNAVKFTPEGGQITLSITEKPSLIAGNGYYEFIFEDSGIGMKPEFIEHIFEPFARADDSRTGRIEGTGLGMPISKNIVRMMNGTIDVESTLGVGSKFIVRLYLRLQDTGSEDISSLQDLKVLVVDDDQSACENASEILNSIGMHSEWVLSGDDAIAHLLRAHKKHMDYAAVILDWKMPGKDGVETAKEIRERISDSLPIIILSAFDWSAIEQEAREAGVNAFIAKPLFRSRLVYAMKSVVSLEQEPDPVPSDILSVQNKDYSGKRILLVEDNLLNIEIAEELLSTMGFAVEKAYDGKEAVDRIWETPKGYYDLILMDIQMPNMNGYDAASAIRASGREDLASIPIIAMTADAFTEDVVHAKSAGMNAHISKPIEIDNLLKTLDEWL